MTMLLLYKDIWFFFVGKPPIDDFRTVAHIKTLVHQLYSAMNIEQHQVCKEIFLSSLTCLILWFVKKKLFMKLIFQVLGVVVDKYYWGGGWGCWGTVHEMGNLRVEDGRGGADTGLEVDKRRD